MRLVVLFALLPVATSSFADAPKPKADPIGKVSKSPEQWRKQLTPDQYRVLREAGGGRRFLDMEFIPRRGDQGADEGSLLLARDVRPDRLVRAMRYRPSVNARIPQFLSQA